MIKCIESGVGGKGLSFDYLSEIRDRAIKFRLVGTTFFKVDGSIKVIAGGEAVALEEFVKTLKPNRFFSTIENFYILWKEPNNKYTDFSIN